MTPFALEHRACREGPVHLLPTGSVVLTFSREGAMQVVTPHRDVRTMRDLSACASLAPHFIKCLLGEPRRWLDRTLSLEAHPMLAPFAPCRTVADVIPLLDELRASLAVTAEEADFLSLWAAYRADSASLPTRDRSVQRLCLRYAGQSARALKIVARLSSTLAADDESGLRNSLGAFADQSHYARVCRAHTGRPPGRWLPLSQAFY